MKNYEINTFSIIGYDPKTSWLWIAVASKWLAVWSIVPYIEPGVWAIATQAHTNISFWKNWLKEIKKWKKIDQVLKELLSHDRKSEFRQIAIMDTQWNWVAHTWRECSKFAWVIVSDNCIVQWNTLTWEGVIKDMNESFKKSSWDLANRLYSALLAWENSGWDKRWKQSASLLVLDNQDIGTEVTWDIIDLRIDNSDDPIKELWLLLEKHHELYK